MSVPKPAAADLTETKASAEQRSHRESLYRLYRDSPIPLEHLLQHPALYMRSSALAKILMLHELYQLVVDIPGIIVEFGCWLGQNLVLCENLRAIYEPFNQSRRVIGFDTFTGYASLTDMDTASVFTSGGYQLPEGYSDHLQELLAYHEANNVLGHIKKHELVVGDVLETAPKWFAENPQHLVALAYLDLATYEPTKACLNAIKPHLVPGSVLLMDELNDRAYPGATIAFKEVFGNMKYRVVKSKFMTDRSIVVVEQ